MPPKVVPILGAKYSNWTLLDEGTPPGTGNTKVWAVCNCGEIQLKVLASLRSQSSKHCRSCRYLARAAETAEKYSFTAEGRRCFTCSEHKSWDSFASGAGTCRRCRRDQWLYRNYKMRIADFEAMLAEQQGLCPICKLLLPEDVSKCHVDHDHDTGITREILCMSCNLLLGAAFDDAVVLIAASRYLMRHRSAKQKSKRTTYA